MHPHSVIILGVLPTLIASLCGTRFELPLIFGLTTWLMVYPSNFYRPNDEDTLALVLQFYLAVALLVLTYAMAVFGPARI